MVDTQESHGATTWHSSENTVQGSDTAIFEKIFRQAGDGGRWQLMMVLLTSYTAFVSSVDTFSLVFKMDAPNHWCLSNVSLTNTCSEQNRCLCLPVAAPGATGAPEEERNRECISWRYDTSVYTSTIVTEFDLVCDRAPLRSLVVSLHMIAGLAASLLFGLLGDRLGRSRAGSISIILFIVASFIQTVTSSLSAYLIVSVFTAGAHMGMYCCWYTFCMETVGDQWRSYAGIFWLLPWAIGISSVAVAGWLLRSWWQLQLFVAISAVPMLLCVFLLPESPRWLLEKGRTEQAANAILQIANFNGRRSRIDCDEMKHQLALAFTTGKESSSFGSVCLEMYLLIGSRQMRIRSVATVWLWMSIALVYYGLSFDSTQLTENAYLAMGLSGLFEIPGMAAVWLIDRWGRRPIMALIYLLTAATIIPIVFVPRGWGVLTLGLFSKLLLSAGFGVIYIYVEEYFPTSARSAALGLASTSEAAGGALAPYISFSLSQLHWFLPSFVFLSVALISAVVVVTVLPETLGKPMPATVLEVEQSATVRYSGHLQHHQSSGDNLEVQDRCNNVC